MTNTMAISRQSDDPVSDWVTFIARVVADSGFRSNGVARGRGSFGWWAVVDPSSHPLYVWQKRGSGLHAYARSARRLDAAVFTNGPMMGRALSGANITRHRAVGELAAGAAIGAAGGYALSRAHRSFAHASAAGAVAGMASGARRVLTGWVPCGGVTGRCHDVKDLRNFDSEGSRHSWFGRLGTDFESYRVGDGNAPNELIEGVGGVISIVRSFRLPSRSPADRTFNGDFAALADKAGVTAWGLVDLRESVGTFSSRRLATEGVLIVLGSRSLSAELAARVLIALGARDAVAMDQRASIMMGAQGTFAIGPPPLHRQAIQEYGLYCA